MIRKPPSLPDLDDEDADFRQRLSPLIARVLPDDRKPGRTDNRSSIQQEALLTEQPSERRTELSGVHPSGPSDLRTANLPEIQYPDAGFPEVGWKRQKCRQGWKPHEVPSEDLSILSRRG